MPRESKGCLSSFYPSYTTSFTLGCSLPSRWPPNQTASVWLSWLGEAEGGAGAFLGCYSWPGFTRSPAASSAGIGKCQELSEEERGTTVRFPYLHHSPPFPAPPTWCPLDLSRIERWLHSLTLYFSTLATLGWVDFNSHNPPASSAGS